MTNTTINIAQHGWGPEMRGEYVRVEPSGHLLRCIHATENTMTYRHLWPWAWVERLHCWYEDRILWPLKDWWGGR